MIARSTAIAAALCALLSHSLVGQGAPSPPQQPTNEAPIYRITVVERFILDEPECLKVKPLEPGAPLDLAEARNAVELARLAGADRYAGDSFAKAQKLLTDAEVAREAREALNLAQAERERAQVERERALAEETRRRQAEADAQNAAVARAAAERERLEIERARQEALKAQSEAEQAQAAVAQAEQEKNALRDRLREQLSVILETRETARGLIVNVSDVLFDTGSATLKPGAREKLARVAGILASHPDLKIEIEGHTDSVGGDDYNQRLSERRAESVRTYLVQQKIAATSVDAEGFGESRPVANNASPAGRQKNRRVELVVSGESIERTRDPQSLRAVAPCQRTRAPRAPPACGLAVWRSARGRNRCRFEAWPRGSKPVSCRRCCCFAARTCRTI